MRPRPGFRVFTAVALILCMFGVSPAGANVVINEVSAATTDRLLRWSEDGVPALGAGLSWTAPEFDDSDWETRPAPFIFEAPPPPPPLWDFEVANDFEGWRPQGTVGHVRVDDGALQFDYPFDELSAPRMYLAGLGVDSAAYPYARIDIEMLDAPTNLPVRCVLWWEQDAGGENEGTGTKFFDVDPTAGAQTIFLDLASPADNWLDPWAGNVSTLSIEAPWQFQNIEGYPPWAAGIWRESTTRIHRIELLGEVPSRKKAQEDLLPPPTSVYLRKSFSVSETDAALSNPVAFEMLDFQDGFAAYLNGVEVLRKSLGASHGFVYHDQKAYAEDPVAGPETYYAAPASEVLRPGENLLAVQVHNADITTDLAFEMRLKISEGSDLVQSGGSWRFFRGEREPAGGLADEDGEFRDWIELHNQGNEEVSLSNWTITDDENTPGQWTFPSVMLGPDAYLVLFASGLDRTTQPLHTNFKLNGGGGFLGLYQADGTPVSLLGPGYPQASYFHSYCRAATGDWVYTETPSPGGPNLSDPAWAGITAAPTFSAPTGLYDAPFSLALSAEPGAVIRYTRIQRSPLHDSDVGYEFDAEGNAEGWDPWHGVSGFTVTGGNLGFEITGLEPLVATPAIFVESEERAFVVLRMRMSVEGSCQISWTTDESSSFDETKREPFASGPANQFTDYVLDLSAHPAWAGIIDQVSVALPSEATSGHVDIDYFRIGTFAGVGPVPAPAGPHVEGRVPSATYGNIYAEPLYVDRNTIIRACAVRDAWLASPVLTQSYLFDTGLPGDDYPMLSSLPILGITGDKERSLVEPHGFMAIRGGDYDGPHGWWTPNSIDDYNNAMQHGRPFERPVSIEFIDPRQQSSVTVDGGLRIGRSDAVRPSFRWGDGLWLTGSEKWSFRMYFRNDYGQKEFAYPLYPGGLSENRFRVLALRTFGADWKNPYIAEELTRRLQIAAGGGGANGTYVNLFINGQYKTYLNLCQRLDENHFQIENESGNDWDVLKMQVGSSLTPVLEITDGDDAAWKELMVFVRANPLTDYANYLEAANRIDIPQFVDWVLVNVYAGMVDWPWNNWIAARERVPGGQFRFYVWDADLTFEALELLDLGGVNHPTLRKIEYQSEEINELYQALKLSPEFRSLWQDRFYRLFHGDGPLTEAHISAMVDELRVLVEPAISRVFDEPFNTYIQDVWIPNRLAVITQQCRDFGLLTSLAPPEAFSGEDFVTLTNTNADTPEPTRLVYTINGPDPREAGTGEATGSDGGDFITLPFSGAELLRARVQAGDGDVWSALTEVQATGATAADFSGLRITEIMYHPADGGVEFIELYNAGGTALNLSGVYFSDGIEFTFPAGTLLGAGAYLVLTEDEERFWSYYPGLALAGVYTGQLSNSGERLEISAPDDTVILAMTYGSLAPWPTAADGQGFSLVVIDVSANLGDAANWRASTALDGSPGAGEATPVPIPAVLINEALSHTDLPAVDAIEIHNPGSVSADLRGWFLTDDRMVPQRARIPDDPAYVLPAGGFAVIDETVFRDAPGSLAGTPLPGFALSSLGGEDVYLFSADGEGTLTGYSHGFRLGAAENGVSFGRYVSSDDVEHFVAQADTSLGAVNIGPKVGPVVISAIHYHPLDGDIEYIELTNASGADVALWDVSADGDPDNTWQLEGIGFGFRRDKTLRAGARLLVVNATPSEFKALYDVPRAIAVHGPFGNIAADGTGSLDNGGETISLRWPDTPTLDGDVPYIVMDAVRYDDTPAWPSADGNGRALGRIDNNAFANDLANWKAVTPYDWPVAEGEGEPVPDGEPQPDGEPVPEAEAQQDGEPPRDGEADGEAEPPSQGETPSEGEAATEGEGEPPVTEAESAEEGQGDSRIETLHTLLEAVGDGLTLDEVTALLEDAELAQAWFDELNANASQGDNEVTEDELQAAILLEEFDTLDADGDGKLTLAEAQVALAELDEQAFELLGAGEDGGLTQEELEQYQGQQEPDEGEAPDDDGEPQEGALEAEPEGEAKQAGCACLGPDTGEKGLRDYLGDVLLLGLGLTVLLAFTRSAAR